MYTLLTGHFPFENDDILKLKALIEIGNVDYDNESLKKCSNECIDLIKQLLNRNKNRISAKEALNHNWFKKLNIKERLNEIPYDKIKSVLDNIVNFKPKKTLQKLCLSYLARNLQNENIENATNLFCQIDINNDGKVQEKEFVNHLKELIEKTGENVDTNFLKKLFKIIDTDKSGFIEYSEFLASAVDREQIINEQTLKESFDFFDKGNNGLINLNDLKVVFKKYKGFSIDDFKSIVDDVDLDENKEINFEEYKNMMLQYKIKKKLEMSKSLSCSLSKLSTLTPSFYKNNIKNIIDFKSGNTTFTNKLFPNPENISSNSSILLSETRKKYKKNFSKSPSLDIKSYKNEEIKTEQIQKFPKFSENIIKRNRLILKNRDKTNSFFENYKKYFISSSEYFSNHFLPYKLYPNRGQFIQKNKLKKSSSSKLCIPEITSSFQFSNITNLGKLRKSNRNLSNEKDEQLNIMRKFLAIQNKLN